MKALLISAAATTHRVCNMVNVEVLQSLGYEVHLAANFESGEGLEQQNQEFAKECLKHGVVIHSIPFLRHSLFGNLSQFGEARKLISREKFDLIHTHTDTGGLILRLAGRPRRDARYVYTIHGMSFYKGSPLKTQILYRPIERWICAGMDTVVAINREEYDVLRKWDPKTAAFVHGVGLDARRFESAGRDRSSVREEFGIPQDADVVLSVGELDWNKNHRTVLEAIAKLNRGDVFYLICGVGPNREALMAQAKALGLENRLVLAGYRKDIPDIVHASDVYAFPSYHEGLPVSLMEAMAGGLPVVCSKIRGNVDLIRDGENGFLADPKDSATWTRALDKLLSQPELRPVLAERGKEALAPYLRDAVYGELKELYAK